MSWKKGQKLVHRAQPAWGVGIVLEVGEDARRLAVRFTGREGVTVVSGRDKALVAVPDETPLDQPAGGLLDRLASGDAGPASAFALRTRVVRLEAMRRADSLGALLSSRVHVLPHQVGAAGRILADRSPRFVLADEVGLGKTIEAGLVFAGLRQLGLAERVLVVVPEHLAFQWLAELFHKFNALFTLLGPDRIAALGGPEAALAQSKLAILSQEHLASDPAIAAAAAAQAFDLVVVDEAHHLAEDRLFEAVAPMARASFGLLLLTATPVRLDPREYFRLLSLVETVPTTTLEDFLARLESHEAYAAVARDLLAGGKVEDALPRLRALSPDDEAFAAPAGKKKGPSRAAILEHLASRYGLSSRLVRNRRVKVGAFTRRVLRREDVPEGGKIDAAAALCGRLAREGEKVLVFGGDLDRLRELQARIAATAAARGAPLRRRAEPGGPGPAGGPLPRPGGAHAAPLRRVGRRGSQLPVRLAPGLPRPPRLPAHPGAAHRPARPAGTVTPGGDPRPARARGGGLPGRPLREGDRHLRGAGGRPRRGAGLGAGGARGAARPAHREGAAGLPARDRGARRRGAGAPSTRGTTRCSTCARRRSRS